MKAEHKLAYQSGLELWRKKLESLERADQLRCKVCDTVEDVENACTEECPANNSNLCHRMLRAENNIGELLSTVEEIVNDLEEAHEEAGLLLGG